MEKTFKQCKDEFAVKQGFKDWPDYTSFMFHTKVPDYKKDLALQGAAELFAESSLKESQERVNQLATFTAGLVTTMSERNVLLDEFCDTLRVIKMLPDEAYKVKILITKAESLLSNGAEKPCPDPDKTCVWPNCDCKVGAVEGKEPEVTAFDVKNQMREDWIKANPDVKFTVTSTSVPQETKEPSGLPVYGGKSGRLAPTKEFEDKVLNLIKSKSMNTEQSPIESVNEDAKIYASVNGYNPDKEAGYVAGAVAMHSKMKPTPTDQRILSDDIQDIIDFMMTALTSLKSRQEFKEGKYKTFSAEQLKEFLEAHRGGKTEGAKPWNIIAEIGNPTQDGLYEVTIKKWDKVQHAFWNGGGWQLFFPIPPSSFEIIAYRLPSEPYVPSEPVGN